MFFQLFLSGFLLFFRVHKKNRSVRTIRRAVVSRRDLSYSTLLRRKPFPKKHTFSGGDDGGGGRISRPSQTPSHHAGISYPVRVQPLTPIWYPCVMGWRLAGTGLFSAIVVGAVHLGLGPGRSGGWRAQDPVVFEDWLNSVFISSTPVCKKSLCLKIEMGSSR